jgi:hypothetical protein
MRSHTEQSTQGEEKSARQKREYGKLFYLTANGGSPAIAPRGGEADSAFALLDVRRQLLLGCGLYLLFRLGFHDSLLIGEVR